jgi:ectoine hydroxylase-related dioxygenase (phytanoyl-CoA dioxygenase family)
MQVPAVAALAGSPELRRLAARVVGSGATPYRATLFDKSALANWSVAWHQDTALPLGRRMETPGWGPWSRKAGILYAHAPATALEQVVALRIHLDDSGADNGPLLVVPGSHRHGILDDSAIAALRARSPAVACEVPAGGVLVMRPLLLHSSPRIRSAGSRRVLHVEYAATTTVGPGLELALA